MSQHANTTRSVWHVHLVAVAICTVIGALFWFAAMKPLLARRAQRVALKEQLAVQQQLVQQSEGRLSLLRRQSEQTHAQLADHPIQLDPPVHLNQLLDDLATMVQESSLRIDGVQPGQTRREHYFQMIDIHLEGIGSYPRCAAFMYHLYERCPDLRIRSFDLTTADMSGMQARFKLDLVWHTQLTDVQPAAAPAVSDSRSVTTMRRAAAISPAIGR
jgi:Tfp pilus assembly protein PilO